VPLDLVFQEDEADRFPHSHGLKRYSAEVIVDRFEPGRRQWNLDRVVYSARDNKEFSLLFGFQDDDRRGGEGVGSLRWITPKSGEGRRGARAALDLRPQCRFPLIS